MDILKCVCRNCGLVFEQALGRGNEFVFRGECPRCGDGGADPVEGDGGE